MSRKAFRLKIEISSCIQSILQREAYVSCLGYEGILQSARVRP